MEYLIALIGIVVVTFFVVWFFTSSKEMNHDQTYQESDHIVNTSLSNPEAVPEEEFYLDLDEEKED